MADTECPYCGADVEIVHDDGYGYEEGEAHQQECGDCGKTFVYYTHISFSYEAQKADCLNEGGEHNWKPSITFPKCATKMVCAMCDKERQPTEKEKVEHGIPSYKEYLDSLEKPRPTGEGGKV